MVDLSVLPGFLGVILVFLIPPGPDMAYMLAVGLEGGRRAALKAILGIATGMSVYAAAVVVGLGEVARSHPDLLTGLKLLGAAYLLWLSVTTVRHAREVAAIGDVAAGRWYLRGLSVSLTNPKIILFFLAVLPRFAGHATNTTAQMALLGTVNVCAELVLYGTIGALAGTFHERFTSSPRASAALNYLAATVYAVLACVIIVEAVRQV